MGDSSIDFLSLRQQLDSMIRKGQFTEIQKTLHSIPTNRIPRTHLAEMAALARRSHQWKLSLKWLHPIIRPVVENAKHASSQETLEYALALMKAGSLREAEELLNSLNPEEEPRVYLSRAYLHMSLWDYAKSEPELSHYIQAKQISNYDRLIGKVNLAASLVYLKSPSAERMLSELEQELLAEGHNLLLSNCYEISAQNFVSHQNWEGAKLALKKASRLVEKEKNLDSLFIEKWQAISEALEKKDPANLMQFRPRAIQLGHWETLRDLDYYQAVLDPAGPWSSWVYYGTPHHSFRQRLESLREFSDQEWVSRSTNPSHKLDPWFPPNGEADLSHHCLVMLLRDFYRPFRVGEAFGLLFPEQYFNPESSPNRIHQTMTRFRKWLADICDSLTLVEADGAYSLRIHENLQLLCRKEILDFQESSFLFRRFDFWSQGALSSQEISELMNRPLTKLQRNLKTAVEDGVLKKVGQGKGTAYLLNKG